MKKVYFFTIITIFTQAHLLCIEQTPIWMQFRCGKEKKIVPQIPYAIKEMSGTIADLLQFREKEFHTFTTEQQTEPTESIIIDLPENYTCKTVEIYLSFL